VVPLPGDARESRCREPGLRSGPEKSVSRRGGADL
jgi:hypothetical protein